MMTVDPSQTVILCGSGLSLWMTTAALKNSLSESVKITVIETDSNSTDDIFYGQVLPPQAYAFHLSIGLSEPELLLNTGTSFAFGTEMKNWALSGRSWIQAFHQPFPVWDGVPLTNLIQQQDGASLQDCLISVQAARKGVFAHPPEDGSHPLSRAEYGYAFSAADLTALYKAAALRKPVQVIQSTPEQVDRSDGNITCLKLANGQQVSADLYIDCTGPSARLSDPSLHSKNTGRRIRAFISQVEKTPLGHPVQTLTSHDFGWQSEIKIRSGLRRITVCHEDDLHAAKKAHGGAHFESADLQLGCAEAAWSGNCVAIGHAACRIEPMTTAPLKLLLRDIARLIQLFPVAKDTHIEAQEYNRLFRDDAHHAEIFNQAHFALVDPPHTPYWQSARSAEIDVKLARKLTQYGSRGHLAAYDHEPFDNVDWAIFHDGIGHKPRRRDPLAALVNADTVKTRLEQLQLSMQTTVKKMPPHAIYMTKLLSYLKRKHL